MTLSDPKKFYSRFLKGHEGRLHFAAHSHHFWTDISREAQLQYWDDCALLSDEKWGKIFGEVLPKTQKHIAEMLQLKDPNQIAFAPNTHELVSRLLSHYLGRKNLSILTTTNEFHSWKRQLLRLMELPQVKVTQVPADGLLKERRSFIETLKRELIGGPDLFFISQVFFNSGLALTDDELVELRDACPPSTVMVVDGYHAFAALPTDLSRLEGKIFYLGGGYKYAQAGEGVGFMVVPQGEWRPANTGWFAEYADLTSPQGGQVGYSPNGMAFMGATQDFTGLYRFNAVWDQFSQEGITIPKIHSYVISLQKIFLRELPESFSQHWGLTPLFDPELSWHGHFLTFKASELKSAERFEEALKKSHVLIDRRGERLRFGFGLYQDESDVKELIERLIATTP